MHLLSLRTASSAHLLLLRRRRRQLPLQFITSPKMNGRGSISGGKSSVPHCPVGVDGFSIEGIPGVKGNNSHIERQASQQKKADNKLEVHESTPKPYDQNTSFRSGNQFSHSMRPHQVIDSKGLAGIGLKQYESQSSSMLEYEKNFPVLSVDAFRSRSKMKSRNLHTMRTKIEVNLEDRMKDVSSVQLESSPIESSKGDDDESVLPIPFGKKGMASHGKKPKQSRVYSNKAEGIEKSDCYYVDRTDVSSLQFESLPTKCSISDADNYSLPTRFGKKVTVSRGKKPKHSQVFPNKASGIEKSDCSEGLPMNEPFDICQSGVRSKSWQVKNKENQYQLEPSSESIRQILRPGMVLLKSYLNLSEQIDIVKKCRELGLGPGGFYHPSYRDGAKLRLHMMCLGMDWDLETKYGKTRRVDGSKPPDIPHEFSLLVERAIQDSHSLITEEQSANNVEDILPRMSPNICIVNFYTTSGRLGLHQDRDETEESLSKGLPVVSFSVGDSAEFLYGDHRDVNKADKVVLESGDVLIFGGRSRHIFHGVTSIIPHSAPMLLREKSNLRPGRLNLTFRQY